jgi:hypothetical protein
MSNSDDGATNRLDRIAGAECEWGGRSVNRWNLRQSRFIPIQNKEFRG